LLEKVLNHLKMPVMISSYELMWTYIKAHFFNIVYRKLIAPNNQINHV
jgi:hypothetical protein